MHHIVNFCIWIVWGAVTMDVITGPAIRFMEYASTNDTVDMNDLYNVLVQINNTLTQAFYFAVLIILFVFVKKMFRGLNA